MTAGTDLGGLRRINELAVLGAIRGGAETLTEVVRRTGLARASVGEVTRDLVASGWISEVAPVVRGRGRPAVRYMYPAAAGVLVGVDVGAFNLRVVAGDLNGRVLGWERRATTPELPAGRRIELIAVAIAECLRAVGQGAPWGIVAGSTGRVDDRKVVLSAAIPDWTGIELRDQLRERFPGSVVGIGNDSRLAALAEQRLGPGRPESLVLLQAGRRTGLGLVLNSRPHTGFGGTAGDLSRFPALKWEAAIEYLAMSGVAPSGGPTADPVADTLNAAIEGSPEALAAVRRYIRMLANTAGAVVSILDPEVLVLGGSLAAYGELLLPLLASELELLVLRMPRLEASGLGADSAALGALCAAVELVDAALLGDGSGPLPAHRRPTVST
ncbi:ROK family protein [Kribbella sandramycini]|uniref:Putative NBD/HSP70 family sugar kinase n=1 Tax=Kribbella sandramycini TaxID=60450 RepID=A0A7Y4L7G4_9ACTN|nr:ROK family protein [Kribbella sandramycini]MBB6567235.1 putative NBD/HSP70 family sugar kinase [Kribbella sandramycini]NOL45772.1 ROK family protein [Kribbella sandramycini]